MDDNRGADPDNARKMVLIDTETSAVAGTGSEVCATGKMGASIVDRTCCHTISSSESISDLCSWLDTKDEGSDEESNKGS